MLRPPMLLRIFSERARSPLLASHRGLSGAKNIATINKIAGIAVTANIQRQPSWPSHDWRICIHVAFGASGFPMSQFITWANTIPMTIAN